MSVLLQRMGLLQSGGAAFTPDDLFASGEAGGWYDASDLSTLWKDTAGTDPVTADGDAVARWDDKSGNGNSLTQGTAAARPLYKVVGGKSLIRFDGVDDHLFMSAAFSLYAASGATLGMGAAVASQADKYFVVEGSSTNNNPFYALAHTTAGKGSVAIRNDSGVFVLSAADSQTNDTTFFNDVAAVYRIEDDGDGIIYTKDGVDDGAAPTYTRSGAVTVNRFALGALVRSSAALHTDADLYQLQIIDRLLTAQEKSDLDDFNADKAGVTL